MQTKCCIIPGLGPTVSYVSLVVIFLFIVHYLSALRL